MLRFIVRRLLLLIPILIGLSILVFVWIRALPGSPAESLLGEHATPEAVAQIRHQYGLDEPVYVQYWHFIKVVVSGATYNLGPTTAHCDAPCFGYSFKTHEAVWPQLTSRIGTDVCDAAARFETNIAHPTKPTWINYTGGDTLHAVAATGKAVYVQGHNRWLDNPEGANTAGPGAVDRPGIGAINPKTGKARAVRFSTLEAICAALGCQPGDLLEFVPD